MQTESTIKTNEVESSGIRETERPRKPYILRYFHVGDNGKIITSINKKIYFAKDQTISPGFYVCSIVEEKATCGVLDTMPVSDFPLEEWCNVGSVFIKANQTLRMVEIYQSKPKEMRAGLRPLVTYELTEEQAKEMWGDDYYSGNSERSTLRDSISPSKLDAIREHVKGKRKNE